VQPNLPKSVNVPLPAHHHCSIPLQQGTQLRVYFIWEIDVIGVKKSYELPSRMAETQVPSGGQANVVLRSDQAHWPTAARWKHRFDSGSVIDDDNLDFTFIRLRVDAIDRLMEQLFTLIVVGDDYIHYGQNHCNPFLDET
jgi:hypothetical protein